MKRIEIKMTDETYTSIVWVLWEWFTWKKIVEYILNNTTAWCDDNQLEEVTAKYEALKKTQTRLQDIVDGIDDIKKMLQQWTPKASVWGAKVIAWGGSIYNNDILAVVAITKEWVPYIKNNLKKQRDIFLLEVLAYESGKQWQNDFENSCDARQLSMFIPVYEDKSLFNVLRGK